MVVIRQFSVGGVVFRKSEILNTKLQKLEDEILWLVRRPTPNENYKGTVGWSLPKGWIDDEDGGLKPGPRTLGKKRATKQEMEAAATREVEEEGGVRAVVVARLGEIRFFFVNEEKERVLKTVIFFLMRFVADLPEGFGDETAEVRWVTQKEVEILLQHKSEREIIGKAMKMAL